MTDNTNPQRRPPSRNPSMGFYQGDLGGPPDPINFLRRVSHNDNDTDMLRTDSADDVALAAEELEKGLDLSSVPPPQRSERQVSERQQDPPARERPLPGQEWPYRDTLSFTRSLIFYGAGSITHESERACKQIQEARGFRKKYFGSDHTRCLTESCLKGDSVQFGFGKEGVVEIYTSSDVEKKQNLVQVPNEDEFYKDYQRLIEIANDGSMRSYCFQRLQLLSSAFRTHVTMNGPAEATEQSNLLGTDFYRTFKIDNHIHAAAAPTARQFVNFVTHKLETEPDAVVSPDGKTLKEVFESAGIDKDALTIDAFNVLADYSVYQRFDNFNAKYSPFRMADLRRIFLKTSNHMGGRYFAELMKLVLSRHEESKGHKSGAEMRLSIYGMEPHEWSDLAEWMLTDWGGDFPGPVISTNNRWMIQIPRLWRIYSNKPGSFNRCFLEMLENIFTPMFEATLYPDKHPKVAECLKHIVGFDSVDDEGEPEESTGGIRPHEWTKPKNPSYWWQLYYLWANLEVLNSLRRARGLNTIALRPHAGETGNPMHLASTYILCESINHGINLNEVVSLQYLYYIDQVGLSISPLSNNFLFRKIAENPFQKFFRRGLNVTLSTDDPLLFHMSDDALLEEYSVARASFDLSMTDLMVSFVSSA